MQCPVQEPSAPTKAPNQDLKDMVVQSPSKSRESQNFEHWCIKDQQTHPSQKQSVNPKPGAPSIFQSPNQG